MPSGPYTGPDCDLTPDADQAIAFLEFWFERTNRGVLEIGWMNPQTGGLTNFEQFERGDIRALVATATQANMVPGQAIYFRAATVMPWGSGPHRTTDMDVEQAPGIWSDMDQPEDVERAKTVQSIVRFNASVITGTVPSMRVQSWVRTSDPITEPSLVKDLNIRLHQLYGGDPTVVNPSRLMRLPGMIAWPWKEGRAPEIIRFVRPGPDDHRPSAYPLSTLTSQLPAGVDQEQQRPHVNGTSSAGAFGMGGLSTVSTLIAEILAGRQWHNRMIELVAHWIGRGWSSLEILTAAQAFTLPGFTAEQTRREVLKAIEGARQKWHVPDIDPVLGPTDVKPAPVLTRALIWMLFRRQCGSCMASCRNGL